MRDLGTKTDNTAPATSGRLSASEFNQFYGELENAIASSGIALDPAVGPDSDLFMLSQAIARYASGGVFCIDSGGSANSFILSSPKSFKMPKGYFEGMSVLFYAGHSATGPSTLNCFGNGVKKLLDHAGAVLSGGEIVSGRLVEAIYSEASDGGLGAFRLAPWSNSLIISYVAGGGASSAVNTAGNVAVYSTPGSYTFTVPAGVTQLMVEVLGGGGAGGASANGGSASISGNAGGGGGAGGYSRKLCSVSPGALVAVTVGLGGAAVASGNGGNGGSSSFGSFCSATGGSGGAWGNSTLSAIGVGGIGVGGDLNITGGAGGASSNNNYSYWDVNMVLHVIGKGGMAPGGYGTVPWFGTGGSGNGYGSGGTGASGGVGVAGGGGASGIVIVRW